MVQDIAQALSLFIHEKDQNLEETFLAGMTCFDKGDFVPLELRRNALLLPY